MAVRKVRRDAFTLVGVKYVGTNAHDEITQLWVNEFLPRTDGVTNRQYRPFYGFMWLDESCGKDEFAYLAALEVVEGEEYQAGMVSFSVPTANYAVYTHHGKADGLQESWANAYREAAAAGYTLAPFAFEYYPPGFTDSANDVIELYLAVQ